MKRKTVEEVGQEDGQQGTEKRRKPTIIVAAAPTMRPLTLTDLPNELIVKIFPFLHLFDYSKSRRVCTSLCRLIDAMPKPKISRLYVALYDEDRHSTRPPVMFRLNREESRAVLFLNQRDRSIEEIVESIPPLRTLFVTTLTITESDETPATRKRGVDASLIRRLAMNTGATLSRLHIKELSGQSLLDLQEAFAAFESQKAGRLTELRLDGSKVRLAHALSAVTFLRGLKKLILTLSEDTLQGWRQQYDTIGQHFGVLAALPSLTNLSIDTWKDAFGAPSTDNRLWRASESIYLGISTIPRLKCVITCLVDFDESCAKAVAVVLNRLKNLEAIGVLMYPTARLWSRLRQIAVEPKKKVKTIAVYLFWEDTRSNETFIRECNQWFPCLTFLTIRFEAREGSITRVPFSRMLEVFEGLKEYESLTKFSLAWTNPDETADISSFVKMVQEAIGDRVVGTVSSGGELGS